jgi:hypothetical protein
MREKLSEHFGRTLLVFIFCSIMLTTLGALAALVFRGANANWEEDFGLYFLEGLGFGMLLASFFFGVFIMIDREDSRLNDILGAVLMSLLGIGFLISGEIIGVR